MLGAGGFLPYSVGCSALGLDLAAVFGLLTFALNFIPTVRPAPLCAASAPSPPRHPRAAPARRCDYLLCASVVAGRPADWGAAAGAVDLPRPAPWPRQAAGPRGTLRHSGALPCSRKRRTCYLSLARQHKRARVTVPTP